MAINLVNTGSGNKYHVGYIHCNERPDSNDGSFYFAVYYEKVANEPTAVNLYLYCQFEMSSSERVSGGYATINATGFSSKGMSVYTNSTTTLGPKKLTYGTDGRLSYTMSISVSGTSDPTWSGTSITYDITPVNSISNVVLNFPNIDPLPTVPSKSLVIQSGGFRGGTSIAVASITTLRYTATVTYAKKATLVVEGAGITNEYSLTVTDVASESVTKDFQVNPSTSNYTLKVTLKVSNDTGSADPAVSNFNVTGYHLPTYGSATYTARCLQDGTADSQGEYGRLYLTWDLATILASNPNKLQTCTVKLNGTQITATSGSIANGYLDFIFPLPVNIQGNLEVYFADEVYHSTITSLVVPKSIMPLSLYQSGDSVGVSVGRMATSDGFWCYEEFYLKQSNGTKVFNVAIDGSGNMTITDVSGTLSMNYVSGDTI